MQPALSFVIYTPDTYSTIRRTLEYLHRQTIRNQLQIVVVAPDAKAIQPDGMCADFFDVQIIGVGDVSLSEARAQGVFCARAPVVAMIEDHSFLTPEWAETILHAHQQSYAAVGPVVINGNPDTIVSWADMVINYADWLAPMASGEMSHLPGHNSTYKRDVLIRYGDRLASMLAAESILHWDLRAQGHTLYLEASAQTAHVNYSLLRPFLPLQFYAGRIFAAKRALDWPAWKRLVYGLGSPLIPLVRLRRILQKIRRTNLTTRLTLRLIPLLLIGLVANALGELMGYVLGIGNAEVLLNPMEVRRMDYITDDDRRKLFEEPL